MAKKYRAPLLLDGDPNMGGAELSEHGIFHAVQDMKEDISTSFVYGDNSYEEDYVVPDVMEEIAAPVAEEESAE